MTGSAPRHGVDGGWLPPSGITTGDRRNPDTEPLVVTHDAHTRHESCPTNGLDIEQRKEDTGHVAGIIRDDKRSLTIRRKIDSPPSGRLAIIRQFHRSLK